MRDETDDDARRRWFREQILPLEAELRAYAARFKGSVTGDVDDLLHDTFARAIATRSWREVRSPVAFAKQVMRNLAFDALRRRQVVAIDAVADLEVFGLADDSPDAEARAVSRDELRQLRAAIAGLPPVCRAVFVLRKVYDYDHDQIAAHLGISVSTVEKHLVKGLRICSEKLAREARRKGGTDRNTAWRKDRQ